MCRGRWVLPSEKRPRKNPEGGGWEMKQTTKWKIQEALVWSAYGLLVLLVLAVIVYVVFRDYTIWKYILLK